MIDFLKRLLQAPRDDEHDEVGVLLRHPGDGIVRVAGETFDLASLADRTEQLPHPRWSRAHRWLASLPEAIRRDAWIACERAWVSWLRDALGGAYAVHESEHALLLTTQRARQASLTLAFIEDAKQRVSELLEELAQPPDSGKEILLLFHDAEAYYRYISHFYPSEGQFAASSGMHLDDGCSHFAAWEHDLRGLEPVIAHEMAHNLVGHLPIPAWLNEGMAVNAEERLTSAGSDYWSLRALEQKHRGFWSPETIQWFWSGHAYAQAGETSWLAYDLGRVLVSALSRDWPAFKRFVARAHFDDAGASAARSELEVELGEMVRAYVDGEPGEWSPRPGAWSDAPLRRGRLRWRSGTRSDMA